MNEPILLVSVSARMLAELAVRAGHGVVAVDHFGDRDLRALCPSISTLRDLGGRGGMAELVQAAAAMEAPRVVYGAGLENRPDLVARLAEGRELLGCPPAVLERVRDPFVLGASLRSAGLHFPDTFAGPLRPHRADAGIGSAGADSPDAGPREGGRRWLRKPVRGGGGRGVREWRGGAPPAGCVVQEHMVGTACSAAAVADGCSAVVLGCSEQLVGRASLGARSFAWCGNLVPPRVQDGHRLVRAAEAICAHVAAEFGLVGLFGVDLVWDGERAWVLEVNPRPTGSLEVVEAVSGVGVFEAHLEACAGRLPGPAQVVPSGAALRSPLPRAAHAGHLPGVSRAGRPPGVPLADHLPRVPAGGRRPGASLSRAAGKAILFAREDAIAPDTGGWLAQGVRDVPHTGESIAAGHPVCTLLASGPTPEAVLGELEARARTLSAQLAPQTDRGEHAVA